MMSDELVNISVRAVPLDKPATNYLLQCNECGALGLVEAEACDEACITHLEVHGVDTTFYRDVQAQERAQSTEPDDE